MGSLFGRSQSTIGKNLSIATGLGVLQDGRSLVGNANNILPFTPVVDTHSPHVADLSTPSPHLIVAPVAERVENVLSCGSEKVSHLLISRPRVRGLSIRAGLDVGAIACVAGCVAVIVLPVVNTPAGKKVCILLLMAFAARKTCTGLGTTVTVQAKLEAHCVDLIDDGLDTPRPFTGVGDQVALRITLLCRPTIVDVDIEISSVLKTKIYEPFGCCKSNLLTSSIALSLVLVTVSNRKRELEFGEPLTQPFHPRAGRWPTSRVEIVFEG
ncbi:hypothetical protein HG530_000272 [Fusarium avenaceum]|nr:hypothetical protein HG530_000272 [Fusarium avenaceum]